jgi:hypothetical protein
MRGVPSGQYMARLKPDPSRRLHARIDWLGFSRSLGSIHVDVPLSLACWQSFGIECNEVPLVSVSRRWMCDGGQG